MVLEYYDVKYEEKGLRKLFKTTPVHGTYWKFVKEGMEQLNMKFVYLRNQTLDALEDLIENNIPAIVSIESSVIGSKDEINHVVVVIGIEDDYVIVHDPEIDDNIKMDKNRFLIGWGRRDYRIGYIRK